MGFIEELTPKRTEEIKSGLFIQQTRSGKYRQIEPFVWDGKIRWKKQLSTVFSIRFLITIVIILVLVWAYNHDVVGLIGFYNEVVTNTSDFCRRWNENQIRQPCTTERLLRHECWQNESEIEEVMKNVTWFD